jgi:hypothetical protein
VTPSARPRRICQLCCRARLYGGRSVRAKSRIPFHVFVVMAGPFGSLDPPFTPACPPKRAGGNNLSWVVSQRFPVRDRYPADGGIPSTRAVALTEVVLVPMPRRQNLAAQNSPNTIANAMSAGFHLIAHRALPRPLGSRERVTRHRHFIAACSVGKCPLAQIARRYRAFSDPTAWWSR